MAVVAGVDVGAGTAKAVILADGRIAAAHVMPTGYDSKASARQVVEEALKKASLSFGELQQVVSTGYSRDIVPFANRSMTEIMCHARGANLLVPQAQTVIDIGCQDSKVIRVDQRGMVTDFVMNDKCAAGTGRFIEVMAQALGLSVAEVGPVSLTSKNYCEISNTCTVFAETEMISQRAQGRSREDLIAGAIKAIAKRINIMASGVGVAREVVFTGGVAKNIGVKMALQETFSVDIVVPEDPQIVGALGAAIFASDDLSPSG